MRLQHASVKEVVLVGKSVVVMGKSVVLMGNSHPSLLQRLRTQAISQKRHRNEKLELWKLDEKFKTLEVGTNEDCSQISDLRLLAFLQHLRWRAAVRAQ